MTRRLLKTNNQFGVESSSNPFLAQIILIKQRFPTQTVKSLLWVVQFANRKTLKRKQALEPTLQWSAVLLIHMKARQSVPPTNVENQTGIVK